MLLPYKNLRINQGNIHVPSSEMQYLVSSLLCNATDGVCMRMTRNRLICCFPPLLCARKDVRAHVDKHISACFTFLLDAAALLLPPAIMKRLVTIGFLLCALPRKPEKFHTHVARTTHAPASF